MQNDTIYYKNTNKNICNLIFSIFFSSNIYSIQVIPLNLGLY